MEETWELAVVSMTKRFFGEELERLNSVPDEVLERILEQERLAEIQKNRVELLKSRSRFLVLMFAVTTTVLLSVLGSTLLGDNFFLRLNSELLKPTDGLSIIAAALVLLMSFVNLLRNVTVGISSDREVIEDTKKKEHARELQFSFLGLRVGFKEPVKPRESVSQTTGALDDALLRTTSGSWSDPLLSAKNNLMEENSRLSSRSRGNLGVGIAVALVGVIYLLAIIFFPSLFPIQSEVGNLDWLPRLSLFFFIQLFAVFFLRLYVSDEKRIQGNTEEITNIFLRLTAGKIPVGENGQNHILSEKLSIEDRRRNLKKNSSKSPDAQTINLVTEIVKIIRDTK